MDCPVNQFNLEAVTDMFSREGSHVVDKILEPESISLMNKILNSVPSIDPNSIIPSTDMYVSFLGPKFGYFVQFINGCSEHYYFFDLDTFAKVLTILGQPI